MWKCINLCFHQKPFATRAYVKSFKKKMKERLSVLKQDMDKFPEYEFYRSKPTDRRVYVWGEATTGACGINESLKTQSYAKEVRFPTRLPFAERFDVIDIAAGYGFTLFACKPRRGDATLFGCGLNTDAQLGYQKLGGKTNRPMELMIYPAPIVLPKRSDTENMQIVKVAAGRAHSIALSASNVLFTLGNNAYGQCGRPIVENETFHSSQLVHRIESKSIVGDEHDKIKDIVCGLDHSLLLTESGKVFSCGWGADGQTGLGHFDSVDGWCRVRGDIEHEKITKLATKFDCVLALNDKNEAFGWGNSEYNQLHLNDSKQQMNTPIHLNMFENCGKIIDIASGGSICMVLNDEGDVFVWGFGMVGLGPKAEQIRRPTRIPPALFGRNDFSPDSKVRAIYAGFSHFGVVTTTNDLFMWGKNRAYCLGLRHDKDQYFPLKVPLPVQVEKLDFGVDHTVAYCKAFM